MGRPTHKPLKIAFQGERGAFSEEALRQLCGPEASPVPRESFAAVFDAVANRETDAAVIPIENTLHGSIHENYDRLLTHRLVIAGETQIRIAHNLIAAPGVRLAQIKRVFSHPVALNQCRNFLAAHPRFEVSPFYDTAGSVKMILEQNLRDAAAIASDIAARFYGAAVLRRSIEDDRQNYTRFFRLERAKSAAGRPQSRLTARVSSKQLRAASGNDWKTSLVFTTRNSPGALFRALGVFALRDLSLTKIESRPLRGKPWEYLFYLDFLGRVDDDAPKNALANLGEFADFLRVLGSYPRGC